MKLINIQDLLNNYAALEWQNTFGARFVKILREFSVGAGNITPRFMPDIEIIRHTEKWSPYNSGWYMDIRPLPNSYKSNTEFTRAFRTILEKLWDSWPGEMRFSAIPRYSGRQTRHAIIQLGLTQNKKREAFIPGGIYTINKRQMQSLFSEYSTLVFFSTNYNFKVGIPVRFVADLENNKKELVDSTKEKISNSFKSLLFFPLALFAIIIFNNVKRG